MKTPPRTSRTHASRLAPSPIRRPAVLPACLPAAAALAIVLAAPWGHGTCGAAERIVLARDGRPAATIVVSKDAGRVPWYAARELQEHVRKIAGATLPIATDAEEVRGVRVIVGAGRLTEALGIPTRELGPQEYVIAYRKDALVLAGRDPEDDPFPVRVTGRIERAEGRFGRALDLGDACHAVSLEGHGFSDEAGSMEAWVRLGAARADAGTIFRLDGSPWTYHIVDTQGEGLRYVVWDGTTGRSVTSPAVAPGWHHVRASHDAAAGKIELFVDGASCGTAPYAATTCRTAPFLHIGAFVSEGRAANRFLGRIDEVLLSRASGPPRAGAAEGPAQADADTLALLRFDEEGGPPRESSGRGREAPPPPPLDDAFSPQGTCHAVFDFLERSCGVRWYAPGDLGTVLSKRETLEVSGPDVRRRPAFEFRHHAPSGIGRAWVGLVPRPDDQDLRRFIFRRRLGGRSFMTNHSFYDFYDRFWERNPDRPALFEGRHEEYFARGYEGKPPQLCYTSPDLVARVVQDARARLDAGAGYVQLVPMDNDQQCRCDGCRALLDTGTKSRQFSTGKASRLFWTFANSVARELRRTRPDGLVGTIAYYDYAFPPPFAIEPNILVGPCLHTRNWWCPAMERNDLAFYKGWCEKAPGRLHCVWLYQCFPGEIGDVNGFHAFPGFHAHTLARQFRMFAADGVRGIFLCGVADYIDGYLTFRSLDDPEYDVDAALDEFFARYYGGAAAPMKRLYLEIERVYTDPASYPEAVRREDAHFHQTEEMAWGYLGTAERLEAWAKLVGEAKAAAAEPEETARVAAFEADLFQPMVEARKRWESRQGGR